MKNHNDPALWKQKIVVAALNVQRSTQSFESFLWNAWSRTNPESGNGAKSTDRTQNLPKDTSKPFLFKKDVYNPAEISTLRKLCEQDYGKFAPFQCRKGTPEEWKIVQGIVKGGDIG